ncbi:MAG: PIN domain-containing protein, partial [Prevotellaceae bacterium]|nr:PIN domain-containing protein [Prevotellaceae bacterium]
GFVRLDGEGAEGVYETGDEMRLYLDTNILVFMFQKNEGSINRDVAAMLDDCSDQMSASVLCVAEMSQLVRTRGIIGKKKSQRPTQSVREWLEKSGIDIVYLNEAHLRTYAELPVFGDHRDVVDRLIIAQAITDRATLVSSDLKFPKYEGNGLRLVVNRKRGAD